MGIIRRFKLRRLHSRLKRLGGIVLGEKFPEYKKEWKKQRIKHPDALSSIDFVFFCFIKEANKIK